MRRVYGVLEKQFHGYFVHADMAKGVTGANLLAFLERRLDNAQVRLDGHGINYYIPQPEQPNGSCNFVAFTDKATMTFTTNRPMRWSTRWMAPSLPRNLPYIRLLSTSPRLRP